MANNNIVPSPVLALPPLEYDVQYMNNMIRLLNYFIEQQDNPGSMRGTDLVLTLTNSTITQPVASITYITDPLSALVNKTIVNIVNLPTTATGLVSGDVWNSAGTLKIV
jgi:hypothetical protein